MISIEPLLNRLEERLQSLVEGSAARLLPSGESRPEPAPAETIAEQTAQITVQPDPAQAVQPIPAGAFLVVDGVRLFPLDQPVVTIGRAAENDLVLDDRRVSRQHAQLRAVAGRFVIFDLDSTGGTRVNGQAVCQHPLSPGDVILLAGVPLVYGQESLDGAGNTQEMRVEAGK